MAPAGRALALCHRHCGRGRRRRPGASTPARAQEQATRGLPIIRDTEIEQLLRDYATPILQRGRPCQAERQRRHPQRPRLQRLRHGRPPHLHQCRRAVRRQDAERDHRRVRARNRPSCRRPSCCACASSSPRRRPRRSSRCWPASAPWSPARARAATRNIGAAAIMAPQSAIQRSLLAYVRTQEDQADHAGVKFLTATGQSARGMLDLFKRLSNELLFNSRYIDPYLQTPPDAARTRRRARSAGQGEPLFRPQGSAGTATAPRHDAREIVRLPGSARHGGAPLSAQRSQPAGALCPRHLDLSSWRLARRDRADRRPDPDAAEQSVFL